MEMIQRSGNCVVCDGVQGFIFQYQDHCYCRCNACDTVSSYPLPTKKTLASHYAQKFEDGNYSLLREYSTQYMAVHRGYSDLIEARLQDKNHEIKNKKVLDIGCFIGDFLTVISIRGADVYGLEMQPQAVEIASKKFPDHIFQADINDGHLPSIEFDVICMFAVIEHLIHPVRALKRATDLLKPGGLMVLQTPDASSALAKVLGKYWPMYTPIEHIHIFSRLSLSRALQDLHYVDIRIRQHWKKLPVAYVFKQFQNFGPEFYRMLKHFGFLLNKTKFSVPFYCGEMIVTAMKPNE